MECGVCGRERGHLGEMSFDLIWELGVSVRLGFYRGGGVGLGWAEVNVGWAKLKISSTIHIKTLVIFPFVNE